MNTVTVARGSIVKGAYKRPNRPTSEMAVEVSAVVEGKTNRGPATYLFGVRVDDAAPGSVVAIRSTGFDPRRVSIVKASTKIVPLDLSNWFMGANTEHFGFVEELSDPEDQDWALRDGKLRVVDLLIDSVEVYVSEAE